MTSIRYTWGGPRSRFDVIGLSRGNVFFWSVYFFSTAPLVSILYISHFAAYISYNKSLFGVLYVSYDFRLCIYMIKFKTLVVRLPCVVYKQDEVRFDVFI